MVSSREDKPSKKRKIAKDRVLGADIQDLV